MKAYVMVLNLFKMDQRYKRLGKNTILIFIGSIGSKFITFLMLPYYTRFLSTSEYGESDLIITYSTILMAFLTCCISDAILVYSKDKQRSEQSAYFSSGISFSFLTFSLWAIISVIISFFKCENTFFRDAWWIYGLAASTFLQNYMQQFALSINNLVKYSVSSIIQVVATALLAVLFLPLMGLSGYLLSLILSNIVTACFLFVTTYAYTYFKISDINKKHLENLLFFGLPLIPNSIMWWLVNGISRPIMEVELGLDEVGIYAIANRIPSIIMILFVVFTNAWNISLIEEFKKPDFNRFFNRVTRTLFFIVVLGSVFVILGSKVIVSLLASPQFYHAWELVPMLTIAVIFQCMSSLVGGVFSAEKKSKYFLYSSIWGAATSLITTFAFVKVFGAQGAAMSVAVSFLVLLILRVFYAWQHINGFDYNYYTIITVLLLGLAILYINDANKFVIFSYTLLFIFALIRTNMADVKLFADVVKRFFKLKLKMK